MGFSSAATVAGGDGVVFTMGDELEAGDELDGIGGEISLGRGLNNPPDVATDNCCDISPLSPMLSRRSSVSGKVFG